MSVLPQAMNELVSGEKKQEWQQNELQALLQKKKKPRPFSFTVVYPSDKIKDMKFQISQQISTFLLKNAMQIGLAKWQVFEKRLVQRPDHIKVVYNCSKRYCEAQLIYQQRLLKQQQSAQSSKANKKEPFLVAEVIQNKHNHIFKLTPKLAMQQNIRQYLHDLPVEQKLDSHVLTLKEKFNLSTCQARYLKQRIFWKFKNEDHMLKKLGERRVQFRRKLEADKTSALLFVSATMKENYRLYGDVLCFDVTYKLLKKMCKETKHKGVGFFVGQDENCRIVLFGMATIEHQTSDHFMFLFSGFFQIVGLIPQSIITDDQRALGNAIHRLKLIHKYSYVHLLDWLHKIEATKRALRREHYREQMWSLFWRLLKQPSKQVFSDIVHEVATFLQRREIMVDFLRQKQKYCLCYSPSKFFGFGISSARAQSFNNMIKGTIPFQTHLSKFVYFVLRVQRRLINRMSVLSHPRKELLKNYQDQQILTLSENLEHLAFQQIRQYYEQSRTYSILNCPSATHKQIPYSKYDRQYRFNLVYDLASSCWRCECGNNFRTGMPCSHIAKVVREFGGCLGYYISDRWLHLKHQARVRRGCFPKHTHKKI